jgi:predicted transcriptional regulator of viral defense system
VVPVWATPDSFPVDPFLLAGKMTPDAVMAYHTALEYHGKAHSVFRHFYYLSGRNSVPVSFRGYEFRCVLKPRALLLKGKDDFGVNETERSGIEIRVTGLDRTLVDVLDRPNLSGSWEEIWRSLESIEFFDIDHVMEYASLLGNATTISKVGFFLEQHREALMVEEEQLEALRILRPQQPHYMDRSDRSSGTLVSRWNLVIPEEVIKRSWEERL